MTEAPDAWVNSSSRSRLSAISEAMHGVGKCFKAHKNEITSVGWIGQDGLLFMKRPAKAPESIGCNGSKSSRATPSVGS